tara:strand:- start:1094 stop:1300 length:207 start_codon:yes stop_codon:yes gene_type:complete
MIPGVGIRPQIFSNLFTDWINLEVIWCRSWENWRQVKMVVLKYLKGFQIKSDTLCEVHNTFGLLKKAA